MREGWVKKHLGEVCESKLGKTLNATTDHGEIRPYLCAVNVKWDTFDLTTIKKAPFDDDEIKKYSVQKGDLLVCEGGETGRAAIWDKEEPIQYQNALHRIRFKEGTLLPRFCLHYLRYLKLSGVLDKEYSHGATILHLVSKSLYSIPIEYPSLPEQQRIVDILDREFAKIDALKANAEKSLQAAKDLFQATLKKELEPKEGWKKKRLDEICSITAELIDPTLPEYLNQTHIGGANIVAETGILIDLKTSKEENLISGKFPFDETMVLYSKIRPYLKKVCCPDFKGICSADIYPLKPNPGYDRTFLYYILLSNDFTDYAILGSARAGMPKVNRPYMFAYSCFVPEYDEQQTIANRLNAVREQTYALQENYQKTLTLCDDLKLSLLRKAFNGEL